MRSTTKAVVRRPLIVGTVMVLGLVTWLTIGPSIGTPGAVLVPDAGITAGGSGTGFPSGTTTPSAAPTASPPLATPVASTAPSSGPTATATTPSAGPSRPPLRPPPAGIDRPGRQSATAQVRAELDHRLERLRTTLGLPGVSAAILFPDGTIWTGTAGYADIEAERLVTVDTPFAVASVSKTFTAALILRLVEEGRLGLDSPVRTYLPDLAIDDRITVRQLLAHTSGLQDFFIGPKIDAALLGRPTRVWSAADALRFVGKPYFAPGTGWHYSNTNYLVLGLLAETVGGASIADLLDARFFGPLGLDDTIYQGAELPAVPVAHGYRFTGSDIDLPAIDLSDGSAIAPFTSVATASGGAGSIATSAQDLALWAKALYGGSVLGRPMVLAMTGDIAATRAADPSVGYGLGVQVFDIDGRRAYGHSGRFLGARATVRWLAVDGISIAVLTNQSRVDADRIARALLRIAVLPPRDCLACPPGP